MPPVSTRAQSKLNSPSKIGWLGKFIGGLSGYIVEAAGYSNFFLFSVISVIPTLALLAWLWPQLVPATHPPVSLATPPA